MSAQAGVLYFDDRPVDPHIVASMGRLLDDFGPDRAGQYLMPGLAMVHRALHVTPEDGFEQQPFISSRGNVLTWDGRLDNRPELLLQLWHELKDDTTDAALAMAAYEKWGLDSFTKLVGDWSLVIWDANKQLIVLASDYMGIRPLHYYLREDSIWWSSTLECLVELHHLHDALEQRFIVGYLTLAPPPGVTPYKGLSSMPAGHSLTIDRSQQRPAVRRFWDFSPKEVRCRDEVEYESELRRLFMDAVRGRLRSKAPVWAQLSGGHDSSAIVCAADVVIREGLADAPDLETISYITDGSPETDERRFMQCVEQHRGRSGHYLQLDESFSVVAHDRWWITPKYPADTWLQTYRIMRRAGGRTLLTGFAGDSVMGNFLDYHQDVAGLVQKLHFIEAIKIARLRARAAKRPIGGVVYEACLELLPQTILVRRMLSRFLVESGGKLPVSDSHVADLFPLKPAFAAWWRDEWAERFTEFVRFGDVSHRRTASELIRMAVRREGESASYEPLAHVTHPFIHRPLVEFILGIPVSVLAPPGQPRGLMRRAFAPFMPPRIVARFSKGYAPPLFNRNLRPIVIGWLDRYESLKIAQLECVDQARLRSLLESVRDNTGGSITLLIGLWRMEQWLQARDQRTASIEIPEQKGGELAWHTKSLHLASSASPLR